MNTQEIRRKFLKYFEAQRHTVVPSSPVIPHEDPTLLFNNAGMNQFKDVFLGKAKREYTRATSSQKCIRAGGKHNDLENVGHTKRHLTWFEMLGNFSFGDYFKKDAIRFAWEVSTEVLGFDPEKLWPTVYLDDDEAFELWTHYVPAERITRFGADENYWAMGDTGPCGPCSELLYDRGDAYGAARNPTEDMESGERYLEYWNLVFMQFNRSANGDSVPLPKPSIDTGAGLERLVSLIMDVDTLFETDVLRSIIAQVENVSGKVYDPTDHKNAPAFRVIADHLRCLSFAIADGAQPSNVDRGYVLRKILRRAVRYGRTVGLDKPFLAEVFPRLVDCMGEDYPELKASASVITEILTLEEESFLRTLRRGGQLLNQIMATSSSHGHQISGEDAFKLKDTYGLPIDEVLLLARDAGLTVDLARHEELEEEARERSRASRKGASQMADVNLFEAFEKSHGACTYLGYNSSLGQGTVTGLVIDGALAEQMHAGQSGMIILDNTPFYAEMGGQVGDTGLLRAGSLQFTVDDCQSPYPGIIAHIGTLESGTLKIGDTLDAHVDMKRKQRIANNHSATHLLHWALCQVLGEHVKQAGSVVDAERLRFDFNHHKALSEKDIREIEDLINAKIRENLPVQSYEMPYSEVQKDGSIKQFFGDKYGHTVRVVDMQFSKELCGGIHTSATGTIGLFRIIKEGSIAAGVRRVEACTGPEAEQWMRASEDLVGELAQSLKVPPGKLRSRLAQVLSEHSELQKQVKALQAENLQRQLKQLTSQATDVAGVRFLAQEVELGSKALRDGADAALKALGSGVVVLATRQEGSCSLIVKVSAEAINHGIQARALIAAIAPLIGGKGGGKADMAQAGGKDPEKLPQALEAAREWIQEQMESRTTP